MGEVIFVNNFVKQPVNADVERQKEFSRWYKLKPVYFQTWVWEVVCQRQPHKYKMLLPVYQGQKVILT